MKLARQPYYRWLAAPVGAREVARAHLANALFDAHRDDPEFGHRLLADEAARAGLVACDRTVWRVCSENGWWSVFGKKSARGGKKAGPPAHDDLVRRVFTADAPNRLWLWDITEHPTAEGKVYLCAIKDVFSNRIVGYSISDRMTSRIAVDALVSAVQRRRDVAGCVVHSDRGSQFRSRKVARVLAHYDLAGSMGQVASAGDNAAMESFFSLL
ncbi:IS3 family transposase [Cellulomonas sp. NPDC058312]|uniref:IS3 family transposase n=1 Tax=Cellulomonas sp. NPDC058312 TaxID=3346441 RepID=UPI0036E9AB35